MRRYYITFKEPPRELVILYWAGPGWYAQRVEGDQLGSWTEVFRVAQTWEEKYEAERAAREERFAIIGFWKDPEKCVRDLSWGEPVDVEIVEIPPRSRDKSPE